MPNLPPPASTANGRSAGLAVRWMVALFLLCIGLQAALLPAQRTAGQAHFHRGAVERDHAPAEHVEHAGDDGHDHGDPAHQAYAAEAGGDDPPGSRAAATRHHHAELGHHEHADEPHDVVYIDDDAAEAGSTPAQASKRVAGDTDGLWTIRLDCSAESQPRDLCAASSPSYASQIVSPLERPPRRAA